MERNNQKTSSGMKCYLISEKEPSPPGDTIRDIMQERGISRFKLGRMLDITDHHVDMLLTGLYSIDNDMTCKLAVSLGSTPEFWENREKQYRENLSSRPAPSETEPCEIEGDPCLCMGSPCKRMKAHDEQVRREVLEAIKTFREDAEYIMGAIRNPDDYQQAWQKEWKFIDTLRSSKEARE